MAAPAPSGKHANPRRGGRLPKDRDLERLTARQSIRFAKPRMA